MGVVAPGWGRANFSSGEASEAGHRVEGQEGCGQTAEGTAGDAEAGPVMAAQHWHEIGEWTLAAELA